MNKILFLFFFVSFCSVCFSLTVEPFSSFAGEKVVIEFDSEVYSVEMDKYYNLGEVKDCKKTVCPLFENNSLKDFNKKKFVLNIGDSKSGFYAIKIFEEDSNNFYFSSVSVRPDYRFPIAFGIILLLGIIFWVEKKNES